MTLRVESQVLDEGAQTEWTRRESVQRRMRYKAVGAGVGEGGVVTEQLEGFDQSVGDFLKNVVSGRPRVWGKWTPTAADEAVYQIQPGQRASIGGREVVGDPKGDLPGGGKSEEFILRAMASRGVRETEVKVPNETPVETKLKLAWLELPLEKVDDDELLGKVIAAGTELWGITPSQVVDLYKTYNVLQSATTRIEAQIARGEIELYGKTDLKRPVGKPRDYDLVRALEVAEYPYTHGVPEVMPLYAALLRNQFVWPEVTRYLSRPEERIAMTPEEFKRGVMLKFVEVFGSVPNAPKCLRCPIAAGKDLTVGQIKQVEWSGGGSLWSVTEEEAELVRDLKYCQDVGLAEIEGEVTEPDSVVKVNPVVREAFWLDHIENSRNASGWNHPLYRGFDDLKYRLPGVELDDRWHALIDGHELGGELWRRHIGYSRAEKPGEALLAKVTRRVMKHEGMATPVAQEELGRLYGLVVPRVAAAMRSYMLNEGGVKVQFAKAGVRHNEVTVEAMAAEMERDLGKWLSDEEGRLKRPQVDRWGWDRGFTKLVDGVEVE